MKKASPIHVLLHKPLLLTAVVVITLIGAFVVVGQASRYAAHGKEWWFDGVSSCNAFMTFLYLAIVAIYGNISTRNRNWKTFLLAACPLILFSVIDWLCENNNTVSVAALTLIGLVSAGVLWKRWL